METYRIGLKQYLFGALVLVAGLIWPGTTEAQITVNSDVNAIQLSKVFAGEGIRTRNSIIKGHPKAFGYFESENSLPTFDGVIISTGLASALPGPNDNPYVSTYNSRGGDKDLTYIAGIRTFDAASLEFEFMPAKDSISFRFLYASDSYSERLGSTFDDPILITIKGYGIKGDQNFAFLPGSKTPINSGSVSINKNKSFYKDNNPYYLNGKPNEERRAQLDAELLKTVQYDGMTDMFSVGLRVKPMQVYRIKIAIADAGDGETDSAILLDGKSLTSEEQLWRVRKRERIAFVQDSLRQDSILKAEIAAKRIADSLAVVEAERLAEAKRIAAAKAAEAKQRADALAVEKAERAAAERRKTDSLAALGGGMDELERIADSLEAAHANDPNWKADDDWGGTGEEDDGGDGMAGGGDGMAGGESEGDDGSDGMGDGGEEKGTAVHEPYQDNRTPKDKSIQNAANGNGGVQQEEKGGTGGFGNNDNPPRPTPRPNFAQYRRVPAVFQEESKFLIMYTGEDYFGSEDDDALVLKIANYLKANPSQKIGLYTPDGSANADLRFDILKTDLIRAGVDPERIFRNGFSFLSQTEETMYHKERLEIWVR